MTSAGGTRIPAVGVAALEVHAVELQGELEDRLVAVVADTAQDLGHRLVHVGARIGRAREEVIEGRLGATEIEQPEGHEDPRLLAMRDPPERYAGLIGRGRRGAQGGPFAGRAGRVTRTCWPPWSG